MWFPKNESHNMISIMVPAIQSINASLMDFIFHIRNRVLKLLRNHKHIHVFSFIFMLYWPFLRMQFTVRKEITLTKLDTSVHHIMDSCWILFYIKFYIFLCVKNYQSSNPPFPSTHPLLFPFLSRVAFASPLSSLTGMGNHRIAVSPSLLPLS